MNPAELERLAEELGIDAVGAAPAEPYEATERAIRERRARGLFADMRFTMAQPEVSCHPELLLPGARTVVSAALCYYAPGAEPSAAEGRLPRYAWWDAYADLRLKLDALGRRLGGAYRVLVDRNEHVDREGAARSGVGFYGKNTMLITRRHGSWVVLGTLVTDVELEPTPRLEAACGSCTLCIEACPTGALDEPGVLDSTKCLSYWTQSRRPIPEEYRKELGDRVYGCDICQDVCPWNRGVEKRRAGVSLPPGAEPAVSLAEWLTAPADGLRDRYRRLYFPRKDPHYLRRNALVALGNSGDGLLAPLAERYLDDSDPLLREHATWALGRLVPTSEMFSRSADLYDAFYSFKDYAGEVAKLHALVQESAPGARTLLDVACGTGKHLELLRDRYTVEGLDLDPKLLAIARARLPGVPLHEGDMSSFDLGRRFDVVTCLFSSIAYMRTPDRLDRAVATMAAHLEPGGLLVVEPFILPERWQEEAVHAVFVDEPELKAARINCGVPAAPTVAIEFHYLVGRPGGVECFREVHEVGLFTHEQYLAAFERAGLAVEHNPEGLTGRGLYVGTRAVPA